MEPDLDALARRWHERFPETNAATNAFASQITRLALQHDRFHSRMLRHFKITHAEYVVLASLRNMEPLTPTELGETVFQTSAGVTRTVDRLERAGLVTRSRTSEDRRSLFVALTPSGAKMADRLFHVDTAAHEALLKPLGAAQRRRICEAIGLLNEVFHTHLAASPESTDPEDGKKVRKGSSRRANGSARQRSRPGLGDSPGVRT